MNGDFDCPCGVEVGSSGYVYVADRCNHRIQYFTASGSFLGKWGTLGSGNDELRYPADIAFAPGGAKVYVTDLGNHRVQYFKPANPAVAPASLGRVKALFQ